MKEAGSASRRFGCPSCGGGLAYDIASGQMKCDRCGGLTSMASLPPDEEGGTLEVTEFHCPQCGAAVYSTDTEVTSFCSFCGSDVVLTGKLSRTRRPAAIVPFSVTREECEEAYRNHLRRYLLAPGSLKATETISHFRPVYVPFWSYEVEADGPARLEGKKSYTRGNYHYDETYDLTMDAVIRQQGILYDASTAFEDETAAMLQHTSQEAVPFHPAYLSGFYAQGADVPADTYRSEAAASAVRLFMEQVREQNGMDSVEMKGDISENFGLPGARFREKMIMMPVWLLAHRQGKRVVYTAINGQDCTVACDVPVSNGKVIGMALALAAVIFALLYSFLTLKPDLLMSFCAVLSLIIQILFSGEQKMLFNRRTRAFEPDFAGRGKAYTGPVQSMLKVKAEGISTRSGRAAEVFGQVKSILAAGFVLLIFMVYNGLISAITRLGNGLDTRTVSLLVTGAAAVIMVIHMFRRMKKEENGPLAPRLLAGIACMAGLTSLLAGQTEDLIYYVCAAGMLAVSIAELIIMNRAHNEYASRPVPFFDGKEETA